MKLMGFLAIKTTKNDGHRFIKEAYEKGIRCLLLRDLLKIKKKMHHISL